MFLWQLSWRNGQPNKISIATQFIKCGMVLQINYREWVQDKMTPAQIVQGLEGQVLVVNLAKSDHSMLIVRLKID